MLLTIEIVSFLRSVDIFATTPDYILASVAAIIEEVYLSPDETLIQEGAVEDSMYLVVDGEVLVHSHGTPIAKLGTGQIVGELAVLDPEPRSASVSSVGEAFVLRIDKESLDDVMADRPEIAQGVITTLCRRVREQGRTIASLKRE
jgi:CRP-like cAMP-binding protein